MDSKKLKRHIPVLISLWRENSAVSGNKNKYSGKSHFREKLSPVLSAKELADVSNSLLQLQRGLTGNRKYAGASYMQDKNLLGAYLLYYWPVTYTQIASIADNLVFEKKDKLCVLDLGSGPAPASFALCDVLLSSFHDMTEDKSFFYAGTEIDVTLFDTSDKALSLAEKLFASEFSSVKTHSAVCNFEKEFPDFCGKKYDIIVMSHALNELWKDEDSRVLRRTDFIRKVASSLSDGGFLILCEPALLKTSRELIAVRDMLVKDFAEVQKSCAENVMSESLAGSLRLVQPCLSCASMCPVSALGDNITCHEEADWHSVEPASSIAKSAGLDRESVKMSYFVFRKDIPAESFTEMAGNCAGSSYSGGKAESSGSGKLKDFCARVVSDQMLNKSGRIRYVLCDGIKRFTFSAKKDDNAAKNAGFFNLRRYDVIEVKNAQDRTSDDAVSFGVAEKTLIAKKSVCTK